VQQAGVEDGGVAGLERGLHRRLQRDEAVLELRRFRGGVPEEVRVGGVGVGQELGVGCGVWGVWRVGWVGEWVGGARVGGGGGRASRCGLTEGWVSGWGGAGAAFKRASAKKTGQGGRTHSHRDGTRHLPLNLTPQQQQPRDSTPPPPGTCVWPIPSSTSCSATKKV